MATSKGRQIRNFRWVILGLLFAGTVLNYADLQTLSVLAPELKKQINMGEDAYARVLEAFLVSYLISFALGGWVIDKLGVRKGMALALTWWSIAEIAHGFAQNTTDLMICRAMFGLAYPGAYLAAAKAVSDWYPARERAFGTGAYTAGATIGATLAPPLIAWLTLSFGWRYAFVLPGMIGFVYLAFWLCLYRVPEEHKLVTEEERSYILSGRVKDRPADAKRVAYPLADILRRRQFWAVALGRMVGDNPWIFLVQVIVRSDVGSSASCLLIDACSSGQPGSTASRRQAGGGRECGLGELKTGLTSVENYLSCPVLVDVFENIQVLLGLEYLSRPGRRRSPVYARSRAGAGPMTTVRPSCLQGR